MLDVIDFKILNLLQHNAELTNKQLSYKLHKSVASIHTRVRNLKDMGYIMRTVAILDRTKLNQRLIAFTQVLLKDHTMETLQTFENSIIQFPEVMECFQMTGTFDFLVRIVTTDMDAYHLFYRNKMSTLSNVVSMQSFFVLSETKSSTAYPII